MDRYIVTLLEKQEHVISASSIKEAERRAKFMVDQHATSERPLSLLSIVKEQNLEIQTS